MHAHWTVIVCIFSGFPTLNDVRANGAIMVQTEKFDPINLTLYPSMTFTCSGNITKLRFLAMRGRGDHELNIGLATRLAMPADQGTYVAPFNITDFSNAQHTGGSGTGYETNFSCREMEFHDGDILAVRQQPSRLRLLYQVGEKIDACCFSTPNYWWGSITCNKHHYRPLVTIETGIMCTVCYQIYHTSLYTVSLQIIPSVYMDL